MIDEKTYQNQLHTDASDIHISCFICPEDISYDFLVRGNNFTQI